MLPNVIQLPVTKMHSMSLSFKRTLGWLFPGALNRRRSSWGVSLAWGALAVGLAACWIPYFFPFSEKGRAIREVERLGFGWSEDYVYGFESPPPTRDRLEITTIDTIAGAIRVLNPRHISLAQCEELRDINALRGLKSLRFLNLNLCEGLSNLDGLHGLTGLRFLSLNRCLSLKNLDALHDLTALRTLNLDSCSMLQNVDGAENLGALIEIILTHCRALENVDSLRSLKGLQMVDLAGCPNLPKSSWTDLSAALPNTYITFPDGSVTGPAWTPREDVFDEGP